MTDKHILVVDHDQTILKLVSDFLREYDFKVSTALDAASMRVVLKQFPCDLIVLDVKLPDEDGLSVASRLSVLSRIPIIMLSALDSDVDRIVGLELGADDYLSKPFNPRELLARIRAVLRRAGKSPDQAIRVEPSHEAFRFADWIVNTTSRHVISPLGETVDLTSGEFDLLEAFVRAPRRTLNRDQLLAMTRSPDTEVFDRTIDVLILRLRRKLETNPKHPKLIKTERGVGYIFDAEIRSV